MEQIKEKTRLDRLTLLAFAALSFVWLIVLVQDFSFLHLLWFLAAAFITWLMLEGGRDRLLYYAFLALAVLALIQFLVSVGSGWYGLDVPYGEVRGNFLCTLPGVLVLAGYAGMAALAALRYEGKFPALGDTLKKYWYVPAVLFGVGFLLSALLWVSCFLLGLGRWLGAEELLSLRTLLAGAAALLLGMGASGHEDLPSRSVPDGETAAPAPLRRCPVALLLFLSFITLGVWALVWVWRVTAALNPWEDRHPRKSWHEVMFCLLIPFYAVYWAYKSAQLLNRAAGKQGDAFAILCLACAALVPPVGMALLQDGINTLADAEEEAAAGIEVELYEEPEESRAENAPAAEETADSPEPAPEEPEAEAEIVELPAAEGEGADETPQEPPTAEGEPAEEEKK